MSNPYWLVLIAVLVAVFPLAVGLLTSYIKISVVLGMLRSGLGAPQVPSGLVIMVLSIAMTIYIMAPTIEATVQLAREIELPSTTTAPSFKDLAKLSVLAGPWRDFMARHAGKRELATLSTLSESTLSVNEVVNSAKGPPAVDPYHANLRILIPAFVLSEIKEGFAMGFVLLLPFLAVDLIVANILAGMGMYMLSPVMISLPLKLIVFVVADGWLLLTKGLIRSYLG